jgi:hypothetical protein
MACTSRDSRNVTSFSTGIGRSIIVVANNASTLYLTVEELLRTYVALMMPGVILFAARHIAVDSV